MECTEIDVVYASGYFDGEGTITMCGRNLRIQVLSSDYWCLCAFSSLFGGNVSQIRTRLVYRDGLRVFRWIRTASGAVRALEKMYPYLRAKKAEARVVLSAGLHFPPEGSGYRMTDEQRKIRAKMTSDLKSLKGVGRQADYPEARIEGRRV